MTVPAYTETSSIYSNNWNIIVKSCTFNYEYITLETKVIVDFFCNDIIIPLYGEEDVYVLKNRDTRIGRVI